MEILLDALAILWDQASAPQFRAWIIGGATEDRDWAITSTLSRPILRHQFLSGTLEYWGRVEREALPEFYSRSSALVVPSLREQFGIVAVEAMMCGCPVVASSLGGLQDIVVDGWTGIRFEPANACSLSAVLLSLLRSPALPAWLGRNAERWARTNFALETIYESFERVFTDPAALDAPALRSTESFYREQLLQSHLSSVERSLGKSLVLTTDLTSSPALSAGVQFADGTKAFFKAYPRRPSLFSALYPSPPARGESDVGRERLELLLLLEASNLAPKVLFASKEEAFVLQEWLPAKLFGSVEEEMYHAREMASMVNAFDPAPSATTAKRDLWRTMQELADLPGIESPHHTAAFDQVAAQLNSHLLGGSVRPRRMHPQIELKRIEAYLLDNTGWLPSDYKVRALAEIHFLLSLSPFLPSEPQFCHGTLKGEHFLEENKLCDFDHAGYYCGPIDIAHTIWEHFRNPKGVHPKKMIGWLKVLVTNQRELFLGACWIVALQLNRDLVRLSQGNWTEHRQSLAFFYHWKEALREIQFIRLGESVDQQEV